MVSLMIVVRVIFQSDKLGTTDSVLGGLTITGNLTVGGTTVTQNQENLTTSFNF